jgi:hypothetical protein
MTLVCKWCVKSCATGAKEDTVKRIASFVALMIMAAVCAPMATPAGSRALVAFQELKQLAGHWQGTDARGRTVKSTFQMIAGKTAVMETLYPPQMEPMVTLYSIDGDAIALMHYCPTNNQPHMRAIPAAGAEKQLVFKFQGAGNLPNPAVGHEYKLVLDFQDKDHIVENWTWRENGKDSEMVYSLQRKLD